MCELVCFNFPPPRWEIGPHALIMNTTWLFKSFQFGNGSRMFNEKLVILEFKYLQNKKWSKQMVKSIRIKKNYKKLL